MLEIDPKRSFRRARERERQGTGFAPARVAGGVFRIAAGAREQAAVDRNVRLLKPVSLAVPFALRRGDCFALMHRFRMEARNFRVENDGERGT